MEFTILLLGGLLGLVAIICSSAVSIYAIRTFKPVATAIDSQIPPESIDPTTFAPKEEFFTTEDGRRISSRDYEIYNG